MDNTNYYNSARTPPILSLVLLGPSMSGRSGEQRQFVDCAELTINSRRIVVEKCNETLCKYIFIRTALPHLQFFNSDEIQATHP